MSSLYHIPFTMVLLSKWHTSPVFTLDAPGMTWASSLQKGPRPCQSRNGYHWNFRDLLSNSLFLPGSVFSWGLKQSLWAELDDDGPQYKEGEKDAQRGIWQCGTILHHNYWIFQWALAELSNILKDRQCALFFFFFFVNCQEWAMSLD